MSSRDYTPSPPGTPVGGDAGEIKRIPTGPKALREQSEKSEKSERGERGERGERDERGERSERGDRNDRSDRSDRSDRGRRSRRRSSRSHDRSRSTSRSSHRSSRKRSRSRSRSGSRSRSRSRSHSRDRRDRRRRDRDSGSRRSSKNSRQHDRDQDYSSRRSRDSRDSRDSRGSRDSRDRRRSHDSRQPNDHDRDRRTVFVQQLAARLRTRELFDFFSQVGDVCDASIVRDKVTNRSKGVAYVEFAEIESVAKAIGLTGNKLLGIPVIVQLTESEKNRLALEAENGPNSTTPTILEDRKLVNSSYGQNGLQIYVGNIYFGITEEELKMLFQPFGSIDYVNVQRDETGRSKGYAFVKYHREEDAREALLKMNGFVLAGRNLKLGVGVADKNAASVIQSLTNSVGGAAVDVKTSTVTNHPNNPNDNLTTKVEASNTDDTAEVVNSVDRSTLMRKLMREEDNLVPVQKVSAPPKVVSRCVALQNMFDPAEESGNEWIDELIEDVKAECESKYGPVVHIQIEGPPPSNKGEIFMKFGTVEAAQRALEDLNGRYFGGRVISAMSMVEMVYSLRFPKSKDV